MIHHNPDQNKVFTEDKSTNKIILSIVLMFQCISNVGHEDLPVLTY